MSTPKLASLLHILAWLCLIGLPLGLLANLLLQPPSLATADVYFSDYAITEHLGLVSFWVGVGLGVLPFLVTMWTLYQAGCLFRLTANGQILSDPSARLIRKIGLGLLALSLLAIAIRSALSVLLSWENPAGERILSVGLNSSDVGFALGAGLLILIGRALRDAVGIADENRAFV